MENTFELEIVTPTKLMTVGDVTSIVAPGLDGCFGVLKNHCPALMGLHVGCIQYTQDGEKRYLATSGGYADIRGDKTLLLVETAEYAEKIDLERSEESLKRAKERLEKKSSDVDMTRAEASMQRALNRIHVARSYSS